jgi:hypothetical protein
MMRRWVCAVPTEMCSLDSCLYEPMDISTHYKTLSWGQGPRHATQIFAGRSTRYPLSLRPPTQPWGRSRCTHLSQPTRWHPGHCSLCRLNVGHKVVPYWILAYSAELYHVGLCITVLRKDLARGPVRQRIIFHRRCDCSAIGSEIIRANGNRNHPSETEAL